MGFGEAVKTVFGKYATFGGRARRSEFWWWTLFVALVSVVLSILDTVLGWRYGTSTWTTDVNGVSTQSTGPAPFGVTQSLWSLAVFIPSLAVAVRRLHDTGKSGFWWLLNLVCCIGGLILLIFYIQGSQPTENKYGPQPA